MRTSAAQHEEGLAVSRAHHVLALSTVAAL